jgi:hypothetical protein
MMRRERIAALALLTAFACGQADEPPEEPGDEAALATDPVAGDSLAPGGPEASEPDGPPPLPTLPGEGEARDYRIQLVNLLEREALVFASAGAGRVALDTVPGTDSTLVDIRLRADRVLLEARDRSGRVLKTETLDLDGTAVNRWEIAVSDASRAVARSSSTPLVTSGAGDYPRTR